MRFKLIRDYKFGLWKQPVWNEEVCDSRWALCESTLAEFVDLPDGRPLSEAPDGTVAVLVMKSKKGAVPENAYAIRATRDCSDHVDVHYDGKWHAVYVDIAFRDEVIRVAGGIREIAVAWLKV